MESQAIDFPNEWVLTLYEGLQMKRVIALVIAVLFFIGFSCSALFAKGGHGGGHGGRGGSRAGHAGGFHGWHHGGSYRGGGHYARSSHYVTHSPYGWYGVGFFGGFSASPWYYFGPSYDEPYLLPPVPDYTDAAAVERPAGDSVESPGEWVEVPGQWVDGIWVPAHNAWVPERP
jgi:hypothetical protein